MVMAERALVCLLSISKNFVEGLDNGSWVALRGVSHAVRSAAFEVIMRRLLPHQWTHFRALRTGLRRYRRMVDTSHMGSGKSFVAAALANNLGLDLVVLGPGSTEINWRKAARTFGKRLEFYAYSRFGAKIKPYIQTKRDAEGRTFGVATSLWTRRLSEGILFVLDEIHWLKNNSHRSSFVRALTAKLFDVPGRSVLLGLSATPFDKPEHAVRLSRTLGILTKPRLLHYDPWRGHTVPEGLEQIAGFGYLDEEKRKITVQRLLGRLRRRRTAMPFRTRNMIAHNLFVRRIKPLLFRAMSPAAVTMLPDAGNLFANVADNEARTLISKGVKKLRAALASWNLAQQRAAGLGGIGGGLRLIELGKVGIFEKLVREALGHATKVVVMLNFRDPLDLLVENLAEFDPIVVDGRTPKHRRASLIGQFQSKNLRRRLLIANTIVVAQGLDLDDKRGDFQRVLLLSPSYHVITLHQATGRVCRVGTASTPIVRFVYADHEYSETRLLNALARKTQILRTGLSEGTAKIIKFPGDYPRTDFFFL